MARHKAQMRLLFCVSALVALGACASTPPPAPDPVWGAIAAWKCGGGSTFSSQWTAGGNMEVIAGGKMYWLTAKKTGSNVRFTNKTVEFVDKGGVAMLSGAPGGPYTNCTL